MLNFDYQNPTRIIFGKGTEQQIGQLLQPHAKKILLHYGGGSIKKSGLYNDIVKSLQAAGISFVELGGVEPNPRLSLVRTGISLCRRENIELILAVGGGSVIDSAKAIAMGVFYDNDVWEIYLQRKAISKALPVACVLTIPAAGSESSPNTVITDWENKRKLGYGTLILRPLLSVIDPKLFMTLPKNQIANGIADMCAHIFERYFTKTPHTDLTDALCEATLRTIMQFAPKVLDNSQDYDSWCQIGLAGNFAHNNILGLDREQDWGCHGIEHELSAIYDIAHGAGLAIVFPAWMRYVYQEDMQLFLQFAIRVMGVDGDYRNPQTIIEAGIAKLQCFFKSLGLPTTLSEVNIDSSNLETMAKKATKVLFGTEQPLGNFKKLYWQDVLEIYQLAL